MIDQFKTALKQLPVLGPWLVHLRRAPDTFTTSAAYWEERYRAGGHSGAGSYDRLAAFKAEVLNRFVAAHGVRTVVEHGSGDGAQLRLASYPAYVGVDVSGAAVALCREMFAGDATKTFYTTAEVPAGCTAELALSLDVIYHLVEDAVFDAYMRALFASATRFVGIYASDRDEVWPARHVRHRQYSAWVAQHAPGWTLLETVPNAYPYDPADPDHTSFADFKFYRAASAR